ncbi:MAG: hypothetical protein HY347_07075, partial [candidate division NC10 bacterium]|nr:hypothetical protein [candidate division NC10 bacterium]
MKWTWICCAGPLLLLLLLPALGISVGGFLGGLVGSLFPILAVLACPLGMYFLMRGMMRQMGEQRVAEEQRQAQQTLSRQTEVVEVTEPATSSGEAYEVKPVTSDGRSAQLSEGGSIAEAVEP